MNYWLVKTEPETYSWGNLVKDGICIWDGIRNFQARNNMQAMKKGDQVFVYHTGGEKAVIGIAKVEKEAYPEPKDKAWVAINLTSVRKLNKPVSLAQIKSDNKLNGMVLIKSGRLSVQPVKEEEFEYIVALSMK